jgi:uncharacterized protein
MVDVIMAHKVRIYISIFLVLIACILVWGVRAFTYKEDDTQLSSQLQISRITIGTTTIDAYNAVSEKDRTAGLSVFESLPSDQGMLFVFDTPGKYGFWMKNMKFPIDIVWLGENFEVLGVEKEVRPDSYPKIFYPSAPVMYVLEIGAGMSDDWGIKEGIQLLRE